MRPFFYEPEGELAPALVRDMLSLVCATVPEDVSREWTKYELLIAYDWAIREHLRAADNKLVRSRPKPWFIKCAESIVTIRSYGGVSPADVR